jgi:predicted  nucleic acid-binding Zn-ribbon protein
MQELIMQLFGGFLDIVSIVSFAIILGIVWNMSKKFTTLENDGKTGKEAHYHDVKEIKENINNLEKELIQRISDARVERKEEIAKTVGNNIDKFEALQKQIDGTKSDLKDVSTRVTQVNTKTEYIEKEIVELKECDAENKKFVIDWNQRIEDRIEATIKYIREIVAFLLGKKKQMDRDEPI